MGVRKVLLVSYAFPPQYDVSARRAAKLCKYLPAAGWTPVVLTKDWSAPFPDEDRRAYTIALQPETLDTLGDTKIVRAPYRTHDNALRRLHARLGGVYGNGAGSASAAAPNERNAATRVVRAAARRALSLLSPVFGDTPDPFRGWTDEAVRVGVDVIRRESIDAICSLCPPATAHVVASEIARRTGVPWVAQFDDLYSFHLERQRAAWRPYTDAIHRRWMSRAMLAGAITPAMLDYVRRTYGVEGDVVMVGFDPDESPAISREPHDELRLAYTGSVYPGDQRPEMLFDALERVLRACPESGANIRMVFAGTGRDDELRSMLAAYPAAAKVCEFVGRLSPDAALALQRTSDALVLLNCTRPSADEGTLSFPAKSFEYLNAHRPILALPHDPGGFGDRLLETTHAGVTAASPAEAARVIGEWLHAQRTIGVLPYAGDADAIASYGVPRQAAALGHLLDRAAAVGTRSDQQLQAQPLR